LDFENPTQSSLIGVGQGPGGWYFHGGVQVSDDESKFGKYSLKFSDDPGNLSKFNQVNTRLCKAGQGFTFSFFFKNINTVKTHRTILQLCKENDPDGSASHLVYVSPDDKMGGSIDSLRNWGDIVATRKIGLNVFDPISLNLLDDEWHFMAVVGQDDETVIYIDGSPVCTYGVNPAAMEDNYLVVIGNRRDQYGDADPDNPSTQLVEYFDYFRFYDKALSEEEVVALMNDAPWKARIRFTS